MSHDDDGYDDCCKKCRAKYQAMEYYEISEKRYNELMSITNCPGCKRKFEEEPNGPEAVTKCIDVCPKTDLVRGVLCQDCQSAIEHFQHSQTLLFKAAAYLRKHADPPLPNNPEFDRLAQKLERFGTLD